jgi:AcrR family transcriptional regulator
MKPVKEKILDAAVALLSRHGGKKLAQIPIAKEAGVPQGHLTYYFPRRIDLLAAVAQRYVERMAHDVMTMEDPLELVTRVVSGRDRTRMLIALFQESESDKKLRKVMQDSATQLRTGTARLLGKDPDDPEALLVQACIWGLALQHLLYDERSQKDAAEVVGALAKVIISKPRKKARR